MFKDYKEYIENIRNNLIQNDIQVPEYELNSYSDVFKYSLILEQVCWFYQLLLLMNSEYAIQSEYLQSEGYLEKVRQLAYREFLQYLEGYKKISKSYYMLNVLKSKNLEDVVSEEDLDIDEEIDLFGDSEESEPEAELSAKTFLNIVESTSKAEENVVELNQLDGSYAPHGIFIDEWVESSSTIENVVNTENTEDMEVYVPHGIFIDEFVEKEEEDDRREVKVNPKQDQDLGYASHGIYIDEWIPKEENIDKNYNIGDYVPHGLYIDEWEDKEEDTNWCEENVKEDADWEDENYWDEEGSDWEDVLQSEEDEEQGYEDEFGGLEEESSPQVKEDIIKTAEQKPDNANRDISDSLQDVTNQLLTEGKRLFVKGFRKLQE